MLLFNLVLVLGAVIVWMSVFRNKRIETIVALLMLQGLIAIFAIMVLMKDRVEMDPNNGKPSLTRSSPLLIPQ